jgi:hypothetical protein
MSEGKNWFLWRALASLILVVLLVAGGLAVHYAGWARGYQAGQLAAEGGESVTPPYLPHAWGPAGFAHYAFGAGALLRVVLLLVFLGVVGKLIHLVVWGAIWRPMMAGPWPRHWHPGHWRRMHGPMPPWWGPPEQGEPDAEPDEGSA